MADWSRTGVSEIDVTQLISCRHANAVVSWVSHQVINARLLPDENASRYGEMICRLLSDALVKPDEPILLGSWVLWDVRFRSRSGQLMFYLTELGSMYVFAKNTSTSGRNYMYCFLCPRSRSCTHLSLTPQVDDSFYENDINDEGSIRTPEVVDYLLSIQRYPFDLDVDEELRDIINDRMFSSIAEWCCKYLPEGGIEAERRICCNTPCTPINVGNRPVEVF